MSIAKHWAIFTAAPHRVMFFGGVVQAVTAMLWWLIELSTRYGVIGAPVDWPLAPAAIHAWLLLYGMFPMFMFGFLMTTFPRWMNEPEIPARRYVPAFALLMSGIVAFYAGLWLGRGMLVAATLAVLAGWALALHALLRVMLEAKQPDKRHLKVLFAALCFGWGGLLVGLVWLLTDDAVWLRCAIQFGVWLFVLPVFAAVAHRMIPFFTSSALQAQDIPRPFPALWTMLAGSAAHALLSLAGAEAWLWLADLPLACAALYLTHAWGLRRSLANPLLGVLHVGFAWLGVSMLLFAAQSLTLFITGAHLGGLAPLHALTLGCFATLLIGMATRVTLGHSGMPMRIDGKVTLLFAGIQLAALLRVLADVLPLSPLWLYLVAALLWLVCFALWDARYLPMYLKPRADGQPG